jgi:hypothetical protein
MVEGRANRASGTLRGFSARVPSHASSIEGKVIHLANHRLSSSLSALPFHARDQDLLPGGIDRANGEHRAILLRRKVGDDAYGERGGNEQSGA